MKIVTDATPTLSDLAIQHCMDGLFVMDREGRYLVWNPAMEKLVGLPASEVLGKNAFQLFPFLVEFGEDKRFEETLRGLSSIGPPRPFLSPATGLQGYYEGCFSPLRDPSGQIIGAVGIVRDVTERALREADEQLFHTIAESIPQIVWLTREDFSGLYYNQRWYDYCGQPRPPEGAPLESFRAFLHPDDHHVVTRAARRTRETGEPFEAQYRLRHHSGQYRWFLGRAAAIRDADGRVLRRIGTATDIHDQKTAEEELRESKERFRALVEQMPLAFQLYSLDGFCKYANPAWEKIWLADRGQLNTYNILQDVHTQKLGVAEQLARAFAGELVTFPDVFYDPAINNKPGRPRWIRAHFFPILDAEGRLTQVAEVMEDVTVQHLEYERNVFLSEASKLLGESLELDRTLSNIARLCAERIGDFCIIDLLDGDGQIRRVEVATSRSAPATEEMLTAIRARPPLLSETAYPPVAALLQKKTIYIETLTDKWMKESGIRDDRRRAMRDSNTRSLISIPLIARDHPLGVMTVTTNAPSSRVFSREEIAWLEELAERTAIAIDNASLYRSSQQAVVARDTFLSTASHELKTPLTALQLQLNYVARLLSMSAHDVELEKRVRDFTLRTDRQIRRLARLVDDMLDISRIASGRLRVEPESMDLTALTREVCERLEPLAGDFETSLRFDASEPVFGEWDGLRIEQVLNNLLTNAFRYGGKDPIEVRVWEEGDYACITVRDRGRGIAKKDQERIFERFQRVPDGDTPSGFGLGLYIAREIVALHHGSVGVESEVGKGSTFRVRLPLHPPAEH